LRYSMGVVAKIFVEFARMDSVSIKLTDTSCNHNQLVAIYQVTNNLLQYLVRAFTAAGWDETRPTVVKAMQFVM